ncbi:hypothetical protein SK128_014648 [Halocaridina rubra]|uniref:Uncharacterized protein n=1 Tax=Halocaridina rubra TaxID=373956 RepID=A0AAN8WMQ1_HALRR
MSSTITGLRIKLERLLLHVSPPSEQLFQKHADTVTKATSPTCSCITLQEIESSLEPTSRSSKENLDSHSIQRTQTLGVVEEYIKRDLDFPHQDYMSLPPWDEQLIQNHCRTIKSSK